MNAQLMDAKIENLTDLLPISLRLSLQQIKDGRSLHITLACRKRENSETFLKVRALDIAPQVAWNIYYSNLGNY